MIITAVERRIAKRYLKEKREEKFISVTASFSFIGILLGVATLIIVTAVMNGFRQEFLNQIISFNGHLSVHGSNGYTLENYEDVRKKLESIPEVVSATPMVERQAMFSTQAHIVGGRIHGIHPQDLEKREKIASNITVGSLKNFEEPDAIVMGAKLAKRLDTGVGKTVRITVPESTETGFGYIPRAKDFHVVALFDVGMHDYDSHIGFIPLPMAQKLFKLGPTVSSIELFIDDPLKVEAAAQKVIKTSDKKLSVLDWRKMNSHFLGALQVQRNVLFLILTLIVLVASFNLISTMVMLVRDKAKDISILRTLGASQSTILKIFILTGSGIGVLGTIWGTVIGLLVSWKIDIVRVLLQDILRTDLFPAEVYFLAQLPAVVDPSDVLTITLTALSLAFLATIYPAWRASRFNPIEVLRYE